ncbi:MAG: camphor resistance protein CrcB [Bacteroidetes bacterium GWE2_39_28]|nr:MAG: camphor resistance protein CrcB [Bacteroidetes bacterium GWE2_39_28]OFZ06766.1 MAG: camphor resistance protein CrcB [Bacteroidetes bacterium RIFOXYB2_FULL_39_7]OFZ09506.1 MAG: camphor resistance protein CrcB [Bacteroidetes bacterium RIFOXYC2_FULL_39_11]HCT93977.1 fluoride efflux transporter CrcB [Rikenellaceae bacterium]
MLRTILFIGTGGFLGTVARFLISKFSQQMFQTTFPLGTMIVNLTGCFLLGVIYGLMERGEVFSSDVRLFLTVGFCGGFTTFSTFAFENANMLRDGNFTQVAFYTGISVLLGIAALIAGGVTTRLF